MQCRLVERDEAFAILERQERGLAFLREVVADGQAAAGQAAAAQTAAGQAAAEEAEPADLQTYTCMVCMDEQLPAKNMVLCVNTGRRSLFHDDVQHGMCKGCAPQMLAGAMPKINPDDNTAFVKCPYNCTNHLKIETFPSCSEKTRLLSIVRQLQISCQAEAARAQARMLGSRAAMLENLERRCLRFLLSPFTCAGCASDEGAAQLINCDSKECVFGEFCPCKTCARCRCARGQPGLNGLMCGGASVCQFNLTGNMFPGMEGSDFGFELASATAYLIMHEIVTLEKLNMLRQEDLDDLLRRLSRRLSAEEQQVYINLSTHHRQNMRRSSLMDLVLLHSTSNRVYRGFVCLAAEAASGRTPTGLTFRCTVPGCPCLVFQLPVARRRALDRRP